MLYYSCFQNLRSPDYDNKCHHEHAILNAMPSKTLPYLLSLVNKVGFQLCVWPHLMNNLAYSMDLRG